MTTKLNPIGAVDPYENLFKPLWVVYGSTARPAMRAVCCNNAGGSRGVLWGYSVYKRSPGYRTDGIDINVWKERNGDDFEPLFFDSHPNAIDFMRQLTTPRCEPLSRH